MKAHLVGGGLSSMVAATYLIRDGGLRGDDITIYEARDTLGGSLGMTGGREGGYIYPGGRVFEREYRCALEFFDQIPSRNDKNRSVKQDIIHFNEHHSWYNKCRLVDSNGKIIDTQKLGLSFVHNLELIKIILTPEKFIGGKQIKDVVSSSFFETNFWYIWSSIMAFLPEHSAVEMRRYLIRFFHILPDLSTMTFILRTRFHQYQSIVEPVVDWLRGNQVRMLTNAFVHQIDFDKSTDSITASKLVYSCDGRDVETTVRAQDIVLVTNGSQLSDMTVGSMDTKPEAEPKEKGKSWALWRSLARGSANFGNPAVFADNQDQSTWVSFTVTTKNQNLMKRLEDFSGREAGRGGLITFRDSNWLITITRFHHPNIIDQEVGTHILWGYGIYPSRKGNFIGKPMLECSGEEILTEVLRHFRFDDLVGEVVETSICNPCRLPYASSVCLRRKARDRPAVVPKGSTNFGFIGQFCEQPDDVIFTMEYSVRSARNAVHSLLKTKNGPPAMYKGQYHPAVIFRVLRAVYR